MFSYINYHKYILDNYIVLIYIFIFLLIECILINIQKTFTYINLYVNICMERSIKEVHQRKI